MVVELRLFEDTPLATTEAVLSPGLPRAIYVASGQVEINGRVLPSDEGIVATDRLTLSVGAEGALHDGVVAHRCAHAERVPGGVDGVAHRVAR